MNTSKQKLFIAAALVSLPSLAMAEPVREARCTTDSLTPAQAIARLDWARKCGLTANSGGSASWFNSTRTFDTSFGPAKEYREINTNKAFTGNSNDYNVNYYSTYYRYDGPPLYAMAVESSGPTAGFYKWVATSQTLKARPNYPSFDSFVTGDGTQLFPSPTLTDCNLYTKNVTTGVYTLWTGNFYVAFYCESSCYTPEQQVRFAGGDIGILDAMKANRDDVITLTPDATFDNLTTQTSKVYSYTAEIRDAEHPIFKIATASGGKLSLSAEHPLINGEGRLVTAEKLKVGEDLVKADGTRDPVVNIEKTTFFGKVYNLKPEAREQVANILIAQGYLVGSARFQNDYIAYVNRIMLTRAVPEEVMPK